MHKQYVGCAAANFRKGRSNGLKPEAIVIHIICGSLESATAQFADSQTQVSAHYGVGRDGRVLQFVEEEDTAFHAGIVVSPTWKRIKGGLNPNLYTIGIEHEGQPTDDWTATQYEASAELVAEIAARWQIPLDEDHIVLHREIRASKTCPGEKFDRAELIRCASQLPPVAPDGFVEMVGNVTVTSRANLRDGRPSTAARIVQVLDAGASVAVAGFTDTGERVNGNACWYRTPEGDCLWAGATSQPHPVRPAAPAVEVRAATSTPVTLLRPVVCGVQRVDNMIAGAPANPITSGDSDRDAVGVIQDLLLGHGFRSLPGLLSPQRGLFGNATTEAVRAFQSRCSLSPTGQVDEATLNRMIREQAPDPRANQAYLTLVLGNAYAGMYRVLSLVAQMEGAGRFAALNLNTDQAGLSFGLIQWAQRPGRLVEILKAFRDADRNSFSQIFGSGEAGVADDLIAHVSSKNGGVIFETGATVDPAFDLVVPPWTDRFHAAAVLPLFQTVQVRTAVAAFEQSRRALQTFAPALASERALSFMIDVANQFGDRGARNLFDTVSRSGMTEPDLLEAIADESVKRMPDRFKGGVRARRDMFLNMPLLSDEPFQDTAQAAGP
jgi:peptidoglycan hydrolase-like protein with peptidoglycan-binding domain